MRILPFKGLAAILAPALALVLVSCSRPAATAGARACRQGDDGADRPDAVPARICRRGPCPHRIASGVPGGRQDSAASRPRSANASSAVSCWPSSIRRTCDWPPTPCRRRLTRRRPTGIWRPTSCSARASLKAQNFISGVEVDRRQAALDAADAQVAPGAGPAEGAVQPVRLQRPGRDHGRHRHGGRGRAGSGGGGGSPGRADRPGRAARRLVLGAGEPGRGHWRRQCGRGPRLVRPARCSRAWCGRRAHWPIRSRAPF